VLFPHTFCKAVNIPGSGHMERSGGSPSKPVRARIDGQNLRGASAGAGVWMELRSLASYRLITGVTSRINEIAIVVPSEGIVSRFPHSHSPWPPTAASLVSTLLDNDRLRSRSHDTAGLALLYIDENLKPLYRAPSQFISTSATPSAIPASGTAATDVALPPTITEPTTSLFYHVRA
jgi:hypothetical protein